jgi:hypothetical protein
VPLGVDGSPDYQAMWDKKLRCDAGTLGRTGFVPVATALQQAVAAAARRADYGPSDERNLYQVYQYCGSNDPNDAHTTMSEYNESQSLELQAWLTLCPTHPQADKWRSGIAAGVKGQAAEKSGNRVYDGTYQVPSQMQRGTFVAENVKDCYWETRDAAGRILANDFVLAAPRVEAKVTGPAVVFTSRSCGQWNRQ